MPPRKIKPTIQPSVTENPLESAEPVITSTSVKRKRSTKKQTPADSDSAKMTSSHIINSVSESVAIATFTNIKVISAIFRLFAEVVGDGNMKFTQQGISMSGMDASHVSFVRTLITSDTMIYRPSTLTQVAGVPYKVLYKILAAFQNAATITLKMGEIRDKMVIIIDTDNGSMSEFQVSLMNIDAEELEVPEDVEYKAEISVATSTLKEYISQVEKLEADSFTLKHTGKEFRITYSNTHLTGDVCIMSSKDTEHKPVSVMISTKYGKMFYSGGHYGETTIVKLGQDIPMVFKTPLETMSNELSSESYVEMYIAPKVNDDDDVEERSGVDAVDDDDEMTMNENIRY